MTVHTAHSSHPRTTRVAGLGVAGAVLARVAPGSNDVSPVGPPTGEASGAERKGGRGSWRPGAPDPPPR